jgi:hypothetical protein
MAASRHLLLWIGCTVAAAVAFASAPQAQAQAQQAAAPPVHLTSEEAHQREMDALHITTPLRPGADGDPTSPRAANFDEAKVPPYPPPPDPLVMNDGQKVTSAKMWWDQRRPQLVELFDRKSTDACRRTCRR